MLSTTDSISVPTTTLTGLLLIFLSILTMTGLLLSQRWLYVSVKLFRVVSFLMMIIVA